MPSNFQFDDVLFDAISNVVDENYPDLDFRYECKTQYAGELPKATGYSEAVYTYDSSLAPNKSKKELSDELKLMIRKLSVSKTEFLSESKKRAAIENELAELKNEYLSHLRRAHADDLAVKYEIRVVMFLDVSGFSKVPIEEKKKVVDLLRGLAFPILGINGA